MPNSPVQYRSKPQSRDLMVATVAVRAESINEEQRSVEAVLSTSDPVRVLDMRTYRPIDEVLRAEGVEHADQVPMLNSHWRIDNDDVFGSVRDIRVESGKVIGRLVFADVGDERIDRTWQKIRQGHLTDVSVGYRVLESVDIKPNASMEIDGRKYTAGEDGLRVAKRWRLIEASPVPVGADQAAKFRELPLSHKEDIMSKELRAYLVSVGMERGASEVEAWRFMAALSGEQHARALALAGDGEAEPEREPTEMGTPNHQRSEPELPSEPSRVHQPADPAGAAREAIVAERLRVRQLREMAGADVEPAILERAIDEGWDRARASEEFLAAVRRGRPDTAPGGGPAIHSRDHQANARTLAAGLMIGSGVNDPTGRALHDGFRLGARGQAITEEDATRGDEFRSMSAVDLVRECAMIDTGRFYRDPSEAFRAAVSGATFSYVFSTNVYARLIEGYEEYPDTTMGWCDEEDVANFLQQEDIDVTGNARLERLPSGGTANHATASDSHETYKIARYAKQFVVDEQDMINDRLGAIIRNVAEMGRAARRIRPDLVYTLINSNPTLVADSTAVFNAARTVTVGEASATMSNLGSAVLGSAGLKAGISAITAMRDAHGNLLNLRPQYLLVPSAIQWTAEELIASPSLYKLFADSSEPMYGTRNPFADRGLTPVVDDRLGANGCVDPDTGTQQTGSDTAWYLTTGGNRSIRVAYLRGRNRSPQLRRSLLEKGQWGMAWDINMDIGAAFMDWRPWYKSTGA